jgi:hypothetical protein
MRPVPVALALALLSLGAGPARADAASYLATADTYAGAAKPTAVHGSAPQMYVDREAGTLAVTSLSFVRFDVPTAQLGSGAVTVTLDAVIPPADSVCLYRTGAFSESALTWATKPAQGALVGSVSGRSSAGDLVYRIVDRSYGSAGLPTSGTRTRFSYELALCGGTQAVNVFTREADGVTPYAGPHLLTSGG